MIREQQKMSILMTTNCLQFIYLHVLSCGLFVWFVLSLNLQDTYMYNVHFCKYGVRKNKEHGLYALLLIKILYVTQNQPSIRVWTNLFEIGQNVTSSNPVKCTSSPQHT